ncbi:MAG: glutathione S-transferase family protein, partial [Oricola sp.]|nr:glutathione S-transferase family protein [Oricola sp.]
AAYKALWPTAKIPLLEDGGTVVPETSIMIEHVDRRHPGGVSLLPAEPDAQLKARLWDRLYDAYVMTPMQRYIAQLLRPESERDARTLEETKAEMAAAYGLIEDRMGDHEFAAGDAFTIADCAAAPALFYAATIVAFPEGHEKLAAYFERLLARPSFARVIAEAQPFFQYYPMREGLAPRFWDK